MEVSAHKKHYMFPPISYWTCSNCDEAIWVYIGLNYIPMHPCPSRKNQMIALEHTVREQAEGVIV
jgi:hypothetical protein